MSRFFGIVITMYYNDHEPPHFHARYGDQKAVIGIDTFSVEDWQRARSQQPLEPIQPLE